MTQLLEWRVWRVDGKISGTAEEDPESDRHGGEPSRAV